MCAAPPAISATAAGYDAYVAVDASGTFSQAKREAGLLRMQQAGVIVSDYATLMVEALADNAAPEAGDVHAALDMPFAVLVGRMSAAHRAWRPTGRPVAGVLPFPAQRIQRHDVLDGLIHEYRNIA